MSDDRATAETDRRIGTVAAAADLTAVANALERGRSEILERWLAVAQGQPFHRERPARAVADHIPRLFDAVVTILRRPGERRGPVVAPLDDDAVAEAAAAHAEARFEQGLGPVAIVTEFRLLRQEISRSLADLLEDETPAADVVGGLAVVGDALDGAATIGLAELTDRIENLRESFLATTLHDVRQPITLVEGSLRLAERWMGSDSLDRDRLSESVTDALLATRELVELLDTMSDASRVAMGALEPELEPASLEGIVQDAVGAFGSDARGRVVVEVAPGQHRIGMWDSHLLRRVVANLVGNALKYSPPGTSVTVVVENGPPGFARLTVRDHGLGMTADELRTLFRRFVRADRARKQAPGLGLGLYAARGIVTAHGGRITVDSDGVDRGAVASVDLPLMALEPET